jgi:hypothetical protein
MFVFKQSGKRAQVRFTPGCLLWSFSLAIALAASAMGEAGFEPA